MIITIPWLKEHLKTNAKEMEIISQLTNIGLEVESVKILEKWENLKLQKFSKQKNIRMLIN